MLLSYRVILLYKASRNLGTGSGLSLADKSALAVGIISGEYERRDGIRPLTRNQS